MHVWKHDPQFPFAKEAHPPARDAAPETLLELMKANGVAKTVIIQVIHYRYDNSFLASVLKRYPGTFQGVCRVDPLDAAAPDHLSRLTEQGFHGVRLSPGRGRGRRLDSRPADAAAVETLRGTARADDGARAHWANAGDRRADRALPDLTVVIDHMADCPVDQPAELEKLIALKRYPKVFVKISHTWSLSKQPYPWLDAQEHVKRLHAAFGPQRLMWATDWPIIESVARYDQALTVVRDDMKFLNAEDKAWMLSKTIERVWKFGA